MRKDLKLSNIIIKLLKNEEKKNDKKPINYIVKNGMLK